MVNCPVAKRSWLMNNSELLHFGRRPKAAMFNWILSWPQGWGWWFLRSKNWSVGFLDQANRNGHRFWLTAGSGIVFTTPTDSMWGSISIPPSAIPCPMPISTSFPATKAMSRNSVAGFGAAFQLEKFRNYGIFEFSQTELLRLDGKASQAPIVRILACFDLTCQFQSGLDYMEVIVVNLNLITQQ